MHMPFPPFFIVISFPLFQSNTIIKHHSFFLIYIISYTEDSFLRMMQAKAMLYIDNGYVVRDIRVGVKGLEWICLYTCN